MRETKRGGCVVGKGEDVRAGRRVRVLCVHHPSVFRVVLVVVQPIGATCVVGGGLTPKQSAFVAQVVAEHLHGNALLVVAKVVLDKLLVDLERRLDQRDRKGRVLYTRFKGNGSSLPRLLLGNKPSYGLGRGDGKMLV